MKLLMKLLMILWLCGSLVERVIVRVIDARP
jgi:hypothetical protein